MCGRVLKTASNFLVHARSHTGAKPFKCFFCGKLFSSSSNRREHQRRHTKTKIHNCEQPGCGKTYHRYHQLRAHSQNVHGIFLERKTDFGGKGKYNELDPNESEYSYEPVEAEKVSKPVFRVSKKRKLNENGEMESLENSVEIKVPTVLTKNKFDFITAKFTKKKKQKTEDEMMEPNENTFMDFGGENDDEFGPSQPLNERASINEDKVIVDPK